MPFYSKDSVASQSGINPKEKLKIAPRINSLFVIFPFLRLPHSPFGLEF